MELPTDAPIGTDVREYLNLDDSIIEIDLTPNRSDCLGIAGVAREVGVLNDIDVTEVEILNNGNTIKGLKKGTVNTGDGVTITADTFVYDKLTNILTANGEVEIIDPKQKLKIYNLTTNRCKVIKILLVSIIVLKELQRYQIVLHLQ
mgnify:CR=1 FL=1